VSQVSQALARTRTRQLSDVACSVRAYMGKHLDTLGHLGHRPWGPGIGLKFQKGREGLPYKVTAAPHRTLVSTVNRVNQSTETIN
jgi:hypothetical protein